jgi:hypothetical protein
MIDEPPTKLRRRDRKKAAAAAKALAKASAQNQADESAKIPTTEPAKIPTTEPAKVPTTEQSKVPMTGPAKVPTTEQSKVPTTEPAKDEKGGSVRSQRSDLAALLEKSNEPTKPVEVPKSRPDRFVGAAALGGRSEAGPTVAPSVTGGPSSQKGAKPSEKIGSTEKTGPTETTSSTETSTTEEAGSTEKTTPVGQRRISGRLFIVLVVLLLLIGAAGGWYYKRHHSSAGAPSTPPAAVVQADDTLAASVGVQHGDLPGWTTTPGSPGNPFTAAVTSSGATTAMATATTALSDCLHLPATEVTGAFGDPSPSRTAQSATPTYTAPTPPGTTASSVVDVMRGATAERADFQVFSDPEFSACYGVYAQTMLPYSPLAPTGSSFASVTVAPATVPTPANSRIHIEEFVITRTGPAGTVTTTAAALFGGRIQTTVDMTSTSTFPATVQSSLVTAVEAHMAAKLTK